VAFERVVNFPTRGIGNATLDKIREYANENHTNLFQAAMQITTHLPTRAANALVGFVHLIEGMMDATKNLDLAEKVAFLLKESKLLQHYGADKSDKAGSKKENLEELITAAKQYKHEDETMDEVLGFLSLASLDSSGEKTLENQSVQLMTIHSAKGLEFECVFLTGLEEDLFPSRQSKEEPHLMDEERRLCYVGMTRARKNLFLSFALKRFLHGQSNFHYPSRFLNEIPSEYLHKIKQAYGSTPRPVKNNDDDDFNQDFTPEASGDMYVGRTVKHGKFGFGTVLNFEGEGDSARVQVKFKTAGTKWLISAYANLVFVG
jgi:DNA helicase-2/ATP-dependent DNA helicase PcrA